MVGRVAALVVKGNAVVVNEVALIENGITLLVKDAA